MRHETGDNRHEALPVTSVDIMKTLGTLSGGGRGAKHSPPGETQNKRQETGCRQETRDKSKETGEKTRDMRHRHEALLVKSVKHIMNH